MLELATILKIAAGIVMLLALWGAWVIYRQRRALAKQNEELKRQKFANKQSRIVAEIAARLGSPVALRPRQRTPENSREIPREIPPEPDNRLPTPKAGDAAPDGRPPSHDAATPAEKPARRAMPDPGKLERERRSLAERLAAATPSPALRAPDEMSRPENSRSKGDKNNPATHTQPTNSLKDASANGDAANPVTTPLEQVDKQPPKPKPHGDRQSKSKSLTKATRGEPAKLTNSPPLPNPANRIAVPPPAPGPAATAPKQSPHSKAHSPLSVQPLSANPLPHPAPKPASIQSLDPQVSREAAASQQPPATQENTQRSEREMALKLAPEVPGTSAKIPVDPHVKWRTAEAEAKGEDDTAEPPARNGMKFQTPSFQAPPIAKPPSARTKNGRFQIDNEASLPDQINSYAGWLASQSAQFVLERYENGEPVDLIPLWFDAEDLERRKGHWFGLFEPVELAPLMKEMKDADNAIYCPFSGRSVEALRGPALEILANVEANSSQRQQRIIEECALKEFVEFLDELKTMASAEG